ncbi:hypothetical protein [Acinetobacter rudis]|uniref:hypothetical protein n=1 Tax=Acinetobacter rudis TaxID=632955 RepID=UPI0033424FBF
MDKDQIIEWRKNIVAQMLSQGICIESIIPDVIIAEEFISTGKYPEQWKTKKINNQSDDS